MSRSTRRAAWISGILIVVFALGWLALRWARPFPAGPAAPQIETPTALAEVSLSNRANSLGWSPDGNYLAAGAWVPVGNAFTSSEVYVIDVAKASVAATLKVSGLVEALAFSPDGKRLAVAAKRYLVPAGAPPAELISFDVPTFTPKFAAKTVGPESGFVDLAWTADGATLHAIEATTDLRGTSAVRRWDLPGFKEPAAPSPQTVRFEALAVSPDGSGLAVALEQGLSASRWVRLLDAGTGAERSAFDVGEGVPSPRLGYSQDGKAIAAFGGPSATWWDAATGRRAKAGPLRMAAQPAGLSDARSRDSHTSDGNLRASGRERHRLFSDFGWDNRADEFGAFVDITASAPPRAWTWRVGKGGAPSVAFSPNGAKLAGTVTKPTAEAVAIWAVPK